MKIRPEVLIGLNIIFSLMCCADSLAQDRAASPPPNTTSSSNSQNRQVAAAPHPTSQEPVEVLSDTQGVDVHSYLEGVMARVRKSWYGRIPEAARVPLVKRGVVALEFRIMPNGTITGVHYGEKSGDASLDQAAFDGIVGSSPLQPLPSDFSCQFLALRFRFYYNPDKNQAAQGRSESKTLIPCVTTKIRMAPTVTLVQSRNTHEIACGETQQLSAIVTGIDNPMLKWSIAGTGCVASECGDISKDGIYTAPTKIPSPPDITITATLDGSPDDSASLTLTIVQPKH
jgi:hypothetical protein